MPIPITSTICHSLKGRTSACPGEVGSRAGIPPDSSARVRCIFLARVSWDDEEEDD